MQLGTDSQLGVTVFSILYVAIAILLKSSKVVTPRETRANLRTAIWLGAWWLEVDKECVFRSTAWQCILNERLWI